MKKICAVMVGLLMFGAANANVASSDYVSTTFATKESLNAKYDALDAKVVTDGTVIKSTNKVNENLVALDRALASTLSGVANASGTGNMVTGIQVSSDGKQVQAIKGNVKIPIGSASATGDYADIWVAN